jgi:hypothetical protein
MKKRDGCELRAFLAPASRILSGPAGSTQTAFAYRIFARGLDGDGRSCRDRRRGRLGSGGAVCRRSLGVAPNALEPRTSACSVRLHLPRRADVCWFSVNVTVDSDVIGERTAVKRSIRAEGRDTLALYGCWFGTRGCGFMPQPAWWLHDGVVAARVLARACDPAEPRSVKHDRRAHRLA